MGCTEYADPYNADRAQPVAEKASPFGKFMAGAGGRYPVEQRIENKKRRIGRQKHPFVGEPVQCAFKIYEKTEPDGSVGFDCRNGWRVHL